MPGDLDDDEDKDDGLLEKKPVKKTVKKKVSARKPSDEGRGIAVDGGSEGAPSEALPATEAQPVIETLSLPKTPPSLLPVPPPEPMQVTRVEGIRPAPADTDSWKEPANFRPRKDIADEIAKELEAGGMTGLGTGAPEPTSQDSVTTPPSLTPPPSPAEPTAPTPDARSTLERLGLQAEAEWAERTSGRRHADQPDEAAPSESLPTSSPEPTPPVEEPQAALPVVEHEAEESEKEEDVAEAGTKPLRSGKKGLRKRAGLSNRKRGAAAGDIASGPGLTNGRSFTNGRGLTNGRGVTNGNGLLNRRGRSNGNGLTNGLVNGGRRGATNGITNGITNGLVNGGRRGLSNGRGAQNGLTRRRGKVNGNLIDAEGLTNGRGRVNGLVNGRGITNGQGLTNGRGMGLADAPPRRKGSRIALIALVLVVILVSAALLSYLQLGAEKGIKVDGLFSDWGGVKKYSDDLADQANPEVNIQAAAMSADSGTVSFYLKTEGKILGGRNSGVDSVYIFIDTDLSAATGYRVDSVGAEYVLAVDGYDGRVSASGLYKFGKDGGRPGNDWNSRQAMGSSRSAVRGNEFEAQVPLQDLGLASGAKLNAIFYTKDFSGGEDYTMVLSTEKASLKVLCSQVGPATAAAGTTSLIMSRLELSASGGNVTLSSVKMHLNPGAVDSDITRMALFASGYELPGAAGAPSGGAVALNCNPAFDVPSTGSVTVEVRVWLSASAGAGRAISLWYLFSSVV